MNRLFRILIRLFLVALTLVGTVFCLHIQIDDSAMDLIPGQAVQRDVALLQQLGLVNRVVITLSLDKGKGGQKEVELLKKATAAVGARLQESPSFSQVVFRVPQEDAREIVTFIQHNLPLLLNANDLKKAMPRLAGDGLPQVLKELYSQLNSPAGIGMKALISQDPLGFFGIFAGNLDYLKAGYDLTPVDGFFLSRDKNHSLLIAESTLSLTDAKSAAEIEATLTSIFARELPQGISAHIIGSLPHTLANATSVQHDLKTLLPAATLLLLLLLFIGLRTPRAILVLALPFLAAPPAIAATVLIFGKISALALGFGIVLLGIGVDFSIHLFMGMRRTVPDQRQTFLLEIRRPLLVATITTAAVFVVVLFSDVMSHRQMATLALTGILLAVLYAWMFVPIITPQRCTTATPLPFRLIYRLPVPVTICLLCLWLCFIAGGVVSWKHLRYNGNLQTLDAPNRQVMADEQLFREIWGSHEDQGFIVVRGQTLEQALQRNYRVYSALQKTGTTFQSIAPLLPSLSDQRENLTGWHHFWKHQEGFRQAFLQEASRYHFSAAAFAPFWQMIAEPPSPHSLSENLPSGFTPLRDSMIRRIDKTHSPGFLISTSVNMDAATSSIAASLSKEDKDIILLANSTWKVEVERLLRHDMIRLSLTAIAIIMMITLLVFRRARTVIGVLAPVASALAAMAVFCRISGSELNMMHLLMGIMVTGLSVDYGVFAANAVEKGDASGLSPAAISICALSSLIGFGVLAFAQHPALHSLGITVLVGIGAAWPTALIITPQIIKRSAE